MLYHSSCGGEIGIDSSKYYRIVSQICWSPKRGVSCVRIFLRDIFNSVIKSNRFNKIDLNSENIVCFSCGEEKININNIVIRCSGCGKKVNLKTVKVEKDTDTVYCSECEIKYKDLKLESAF